MVKVRVEFGMGHGRESMVVKFSRVPCEDELISIMEEEAGYRVREVWHFSKPDYDGSVGMIRVRRG